jgi:hypothetical protein
MMITSAWIYRWFAAWRDDDFDGDQRGRFRIRPAL